MQQSATYTDYINFLHGSNVTLFVINNHGL